MALNPFFLQGSSEEQRLLQSLINEQLKIYGVEVTYLPRKIVKEDTLFTELQSSVFNDNFSIEAYVNTYEGYGGAGDILTKFDIALKDELVITISQERFEDFIAPFLESLPDNEIEISNRPREGDLIYFPLGKRIFEVKFVEHEKPFYQLGKNYVYELRCELFEYEDEMGGWDVQTQITEEIDSVLETQGFITTLKLISIGSTASVGVTTSTGYIRKISLTNDGYGYTQVPTVSISTAPAGGTNATAVAITTAINNVYSVKEILLTNSGAGYTSIPTVSIVSVGQTITGVGYTTYGVGAAATATLVTSSAGIGEVTITSGGSGYPSAPTITVSSPTGPGAAATATVSAAGTVTAVTINNGGAHYNPSSPPTVTFSTPSDRINGVTSINPSSVLPQGSNFTSGVYTTTNVSLGATGSGLTLDVTVNGSGAVTAAEIADPGQHYANGNIVNITNGLGGASGTVSFAVVTAENIDGVTATGISSVSSAGIVTSISITNAGVGYYSGATVSIANTAGNKVYTTGLSTATATVTINSTENVVNQVFISDAGIGYISGTATATISDPPIITGIGTFQYNEEVTGSISGAKARVKTWDSTTNTLKVGTTDGDFLASDVIVGTSSSARYSVDYIETAEFNDKYDKSDEIEEEADLIIDFSESNPFGNY